MERIFITAARFEEIRSFYAGQKIAEQKSCQPVNFGGKAFLVTSVYWKRDGCPDNTIHVQHIVPLSEYVGELEPLPYGQHWNAVQEEKRPRDYAGMKILANGVDCVFMAEKQEIHAQPERQYPIQTSLF